MHWKSKLWAREKASTLPKILEDPNADRPVQQTGADPGKPNGNPINQVRTNEFLSGVCDARVQPPPKIDRRVDHSAKNGFKSDFQLHVGASPESNQVGFGRRLRNNR